MDAYSFFAFYYDDLTANVDYQGKAELILSLLKARNHEPGLTLDLACGTGSLMFELMALGVEVIGVDASMTMLTEAKDKAYDLGLEDVLFICQEMQNLDLYGGVDTVVSILDSVNHLNNKEELLQTFKGVYTFLNPNGIFLFDMNTPYKHKEVLENNCFVYETDNVYCSWQNSFIGGEDNRVDISLDFFEKQENDVYGRYSEAFSEITFEDSEINQMLASVGFSNIEFIDSPDEIGERKIVIALK